MFKNMQPSDLLSNHTSSYKVLIVEDEYIIANSLELILLDAGYIVSGVTNSVSKALMLIREHHPDMVLLDLKLEGDESSLDLARELEKVSIPFIYISAEVNVDISEKLTTSIRFKLTT
jgi:DNA-binding response OmpR family regulator